MPHDVFEDDQPPVGAVPASSVGQTNGVASLDGAGHLTSAQIPVSVGNAASQADHTVPYALGGLFVWKKGNRVDPREYGAKCDVKMVTDGSIAAGSAALSSTSAAFTLADVGKLATVIGAGAATSTTLSSALTNAVGVQALAVAALSAGIPSGGVIVSAPSIGTTSAPIATGSNITSIPCAALANVLAGGPVIVQNGIYSQTFTTAGAAQGATSIPVTSVKPNYPFQSGSNLTTNSQTFPVAGAPAGATALTFLGQYLCGVGTALATGSPITTIPVPALNVAIGAQTITVISGSHSQQFVTAGAAQGAATIPVTSQTPNFAYPVGSTIIGTANTVSPTFSFPIGSTVATAIPALATTIQSVSGGVATLAASATNGNPFAEVVYCTDDITAAQNALTAAGALNGVLEIPPVGIGISAALTSAVPVAIEGNGVGAQSGSLTLNGFLGSATPNAAPYLTGSVIMQMSPNADILQLSGPGAAQHVRKLGLQFAGRFVNTGSGINTGNLPTNAGGLDNGPMNCVWSDVAVFGHDGNHYAFDCMNVMLPRFDYLRGWGGGGMRFAQNTTVTDYGNVESTRTYFCVEVCGLAHGYFLDTSNVNAGTFLDYMGWKHPQCWILTSSFWPGLVPPQSSPTQQFWAVNGFQTHNSIGPPIDFETNVGGAIRTTFPIGLGSARYGETGQGTNTNTITSRNAPTGVQVQNLSGGPLRGTWSFTLNPLAIASATTTFTSVSSTALTVASATGFVAGDGIQIGSGTAAEYRTIQSVSGNVLTLTEILYIAHSGGDPVTNGAAVLTVHTGSASMVSNASANGVAVASIGAPIGAQQGLIYQVTIDLPTYQYYRYDYANAVRGSSAVYGLAL